MKEHIQIKENLTIYNTLIKKQLKVDRENLPLEKKINLPIDDLPDIDLFRQEVLHILESKAYSDNFIYSVNCLYQLSQSNSDLIALHNPILKQLYQEYPVTKELEQFSFSIFEFIHNEIFEARDQYERPIIYTGFEDIQTDIPEYWFKDDTFILWNTYYLLNSIISAQVKQKQIDFDNQKEYLHQSDITQYIQEQKKRLLEQITILSQDFCDRNITFSYLRSNKHIGNKYLTGHILSDVLNKLNSDEYAQYIELDYTKYPIPFNWQFEKNSLRDYLDLSVLTNFERLVNLLSNVLFLKELSEISAPIEVEQIETESAESIEAVDTKTVSNPKTVEPVLNTGVSQDKEKPEQLIEDATESNTEDHDSISSLAEDIPQLKEFFEIYQTEISSKPIKNIPVGYILPVPILNQIYEEFDNELWHSITLVDFLNIFTTGINQQENFKLKPKQTTRFYFLLKKIWINSDNKALFNTEKEWIIPFLQNYQLSYSAYTNQFIKKEGGLKHQNFTRSVDKLLPKDELN